MTGQKECLRIVSKVSGQKHEDVARIRRIHVIDDGIAFHMSKRGSYAGPRFRTISLIIGRIMLSNCQKNQSINQLFLSILTTYQAPEQPTK